VILYWDGAERALVCKGTPVQEAAAREAALQLAEEAEARGELLRMGERELWAIRARTLELIEEAAADLRR
jgi:hypothetical protein